MQLYFIRLLKGICCIQHNILMDKLCDNGVRGIPYKLIKSYITNMTQLVKVTHTENNQMKKYLSSSLPVSYGVPQGSVLVPLSQGPVQAAGLGKLKDHSPHQVSNPRPTSMYHDTLITMN
jgi:hypothetical protein